MSSGSHHRRVQNSSGASLSLSPDVSFVEDTSGNSRRSTASSASRPTRSSNQQRSFRGDSYYQRSSSAHREASTSSKKSLRDVPFQGSSPPTQATDQSFKQVVASLDISRITDRLIACGLPWNDKESDKKLHRNNVADLGLFLRTRYRNRFMIWNLTGDTSQGNYDTKPLLNQVISFGISKAYQLSLKTLFDISRSMDAWLRLHPENVAIVHCTNGVARTGIAMAAYLRYADLFQDTMAAFEYFLSRRTPSDLSWPSVSLRRYIQYFNNAVLVNGNLPTPYPLKLDCIVLNTIPDFDDKTGLCRPGIELYQNRKLIFSSVYSIHDTSSLPMISMDTDNDTILFQFAENGRPGLQLDRDIQIRIFHCTDDDDGRPETSQVVTMVNFSFHTGFMPAGFIRVAARDLDLSRRDVEDGRFAADFSLDLVFDELRESLKPTEKEVSYTKCMDKSLNKCLARLISYHVVKVDEKLMNGLEGMGISRLQACIALQKSNNDIKEAYTYYKNTLSVTSRPPSKSVTSPSQGQRRPPPSVADLRQQTQSKSPQNSALGRDRSPSQLNTRAQFGRKGSTASALSDSDSVGSSVRSSIQRLESLIQKSVEVSSHQHGLLNRPSNQQIRLIPTSTSKTEDGSHPETLLAQLRDRRTRANTGASGRASGLANANNDSTLPPRRSRTQSPPTAMARNVHRVASREGVHGKVPSRIPSTDSVEAPSTAPATMEVFEPRRLISPPPRVTSRDYVGIQEAENAQNNITVATETGSVDYLDIYSDMADEELKTSDASISKQVAVEVSASKPASILKQRPVAPLLTNNLNKRDSMPAPPSPKTAPPPPPAEVPDIPQTPLPKMRESETKRKSVSIRKRQTLLWRDVEDGAGRSSVAAKNERKSAVGRDGKEVEVKKFEELFCFVPAASKSGPKLVQKAQFTTLLDFRRANVIAIGMSRFTRKNQTGAELAEYVNNLDTTKITLDDLVQLKQLIPSEVEAKILNDYHNSPKAEGALPLAPAETFMIDLIKADLDIGQHVDAFLFLMQLTQESKDINDRLDMMTEMCTQLQTSTDLKVVLRTVYQLSQMTNESLGAGNASFRPWMGKEAKAIGFKIDGLVRLKDVRSADGNWSLLNFLVDLVNKSRPDVLDFTSKFQLLKQIRQVDLRGTMAQFVNLEKNLTRIQRYQYKNQNFVVKLKPFVDASITAISGMRARFEIFGNSWIEAAKYFAEDIEGYVLLPELFTRVYENPDPNFNEKNQNVVSNDHRKQMMHLFIAIHVFLFAFEDCVRQNRRKVEEVARKLALESAAAEEKKKREEAQAIKEGRPLPPRPESDGSVPDLNLPENHSPVESAASLSAENIAAPSALLKPNSAMKNRASMLLLSKKEEEAQEMLAKFSGLMQDTAITDEELNAEAENYDEYSHVDEEGSEEENSLDKYNFTSNYHGGEARDRDSFQSVASAHPSGEATENEKKMCEECFMPEDECYCNW